METELYTGDKSNYKDDLQINENDLDQEWLSQPHLFMKWGEFHSIAVDEYDKSKMTLELVEAEVDGDIRRNPEEWGFDKKPTNDAIIALIKSHEDVVKARDCLLECKKNVSILATAKEAMVHRKKALEYLAQLWINGYHGEPRAPQNIEKVLDEKRSGENRQEMSRHLKRKKK